MLNQNDKSFSPVALIETVLIELWDDFGPKDQRYALREPSLSDDLKNILRTPVLDLGLDIAV